MALQDKQHVTTALTKLASVNLPVIAVSLLFSSHFATAKDLAVGAAESMSFQPSAQTVPATATPNEFLNSLTVAPPGTVPAAGLPGQTGTALGAAAGKPLTWGVPKKSPAGKKDDQNNQMAQQLGNMLGGGAPGGGSPSGTGRRPFANDNSKTEAGFCYECQFGQHNTPGGFGMDKVSGYVNADSVKEMSEKEKCYAKYLEGELPEALAKTPFASRTSSGGKCALGVRMILGNAGMSRKGEVLGNAIEYADRKDLGVSNAQDGSLRKLGFRKLEGFTAQTAPAGAVLVYGGPRSKDYMAGKIGSDDTGTTLGHVTIKGRDGFYTDGKTTNPAGMRRYLVGVYVMSTCTNCDAKVKARCDSAGDGK